MSKLSLGLNLSKKPALISRPPPAKRKTIFNNDDDSDPDTNQPSANTAETIESITTLDPTDHRPSPKPAPKTNFSFPPGPPKKHPLPHPPSTSTDNLSAKHTSAKHAQQASTIDPTIYDYDSIYDAMKAGPSSTSSTITTDPTTAKPKYMNALKAAAEGRKRDAVRAADRKTAREREAEGDEFKDKEAFVTGAYRRQQEELRRLEAEEEERERAEAEKRRRGEGGGMREFHKRMLEKGEEVHRAAVRAVEENKGKVAGGGGGGDDDVVGEEKKKKEKSAEEAAREMGVEVNEDGEVVDKRELLKAGLNAEGATAAKVKKGRGPVKAGGVWAGKRETVRERESRELEEQLLGKHGLSDDEDGADGADARASKSRRLEDELLAGFGSP